MAAKFPVEYHLSIKIQIEFVMKAAKLYCVLAL